MNIKGKTAWLTISLMALPSFSFSALELPADRKDVMIAAWERAKAYTKEYLDAATEEIYSFKPAPEMRSFAGQMQHLAVDNYKIVKAATSTVTSTSEKFKDIENTPLNTKTEITQAVMDSYDYVIATIKAIDAGKLDSSVKMFGKWDTTVEEGLDKAFEHQTHHRGQTTVYLRLKGIKPPSEKLF